MVTTQRMGTNAIIRAIQRHWVLANHPVYRAESRYKVQTKLSAPSPQTIRSRYLLFFLGLLIWIGFSAQFLTGIFSSIVNFTCIACILFPVAAVLTVVYILPLVAAVSASTTIVKEREQQTWDVLLTTALAWPDIILAKLAAALYWFRGKFRVLWWVQFGMAVFVFVIVDSFYRGLLPGDDTFAPLLALLASSQFVIERWQEFVLGGLIGVAVSLVVPTRSTAAVTAFVVASIVPILRSVIAAILIGLMPSTSTYAAAGSPLLLIFAPSSTVALSLPPGAAILALFVVPLLYEITIISLFRWLSHHLGEARRPVIVQL